MPMAVPGVANNKSADFRARLGVLQFAAQLLRELRPLLHLLILALLALQTVIAQQVRYQHSIPSTRHKGIRTGLICECSM